MKKQLPIRLSDDAIARLRVKAALEVRSVAFIVERFAMTLPAVKKGGKA